MNNATFQSFEIDDEDKLDDLNLFMKTLEKLPNGSSGNKALRDALGWNEDHDRYWSAHGRAVDQGLIITGKGKGGSVKLSTPQIDGASAEKAEPKRLRIKESDLYDPAKTVLIQSWSKLENFDDYEVEITAKKGSAPTGGKWTRPDLSVLGIKSFPFLPRKFFEIVTFEVKPEDQVSVEGIYEALSHQQLATRSYCVFSVELSPNETFSDKYDEDGRIVATAKKHGIGVIVCTNMGDWETWDEILTAERVSPDPVQANRFIATCFSEDTKSKVLRWHK